MTTVDHKQWGEDLAAYILGALDPREAGEFERHLDGCERCREELRWLEPAVQALPETVERREPPRRLRESLMAEVRADAREERQDERAGWWRELWTTRRLQLASGFAALVLLVAGVAGYEIGNDGSDKGGGAATIVRQIDGITVKMIQEGDGGTLELTGLRQLPPGKVLEAWVARDGEVEAVPALLAPDRHGHAETRIADMSGVEEVMVTVEPQGGSETPTGEPIMAMPVPQ
ncbi:MAG TPA: anti-sigma factor [Solirubrobacterales bacterium]|nr:anti-sigma factor [Solirubrobacterales bacterium]